MTFEGYNLGHGFYAGPAYIYVEPGTNALEATQAFLAREGIAYSIHWGLERIYGIHPGTAPNPPAYITVDLGASPTDGSLGESDYTHYSGWMLTINHHMTEMGASAHLVSDGEVIRWQFSIEGWGDDLGLGFANGHWNEPPYTHADKTELIRAIFAPGATAIPAALDVIINPLATPGDVALALSALGVIGMTRAEAVVLIWELMHDATAGNADAFTDIHPHMRYYEAIAWAVTKGIVQGFGDGTFRPYELITEEHFELLLRNFEEAIN
jgi:hypothetical protein